MALFSLPRPVPLLVLLLLVLALGPAGADLLSADEKPTTAKATYVGSFKCQPCHAKEYDNFIKHAKKSNSYRSIERLKKGLSEDDLKKCYSCHTTGYGKPGGFVSVEKTPELKNAGCEVCHGPGSLHVERQDPTSIIRLPTLEDCYGCHTSERLRAFRFTPLIHGGGH
ncbi:MAG: multiheme c-type cytochrome [Thermodesulfobacteriota bacterium]